MIKLGRSATTVACAAVVLSGALASVSPPPASAAEGLRIGPTSTYPGVYITAAADRPPLPGGMMIQAGAAVCTILWDGMPIGSCTSGGTGVAASFPMPAASPGQHTVTLSETYELVPLPPPPPPPGPVPPIIRLQAQRLLVPVQWERSAEITVQTEVPAVVGDRLSSALTDIADAQLVESLADLSEIGEGDDPSGWEVAGQDPAPGEYLDPGSTVILSVRRVTTPAPDDPGPPAPPQLEEPGGVPRDNATTTTPRPSNGGVTQTPEPPGRPGAPPTTTAAPVAVPPAPAAQPPATALQPLADRLRVPLMFALLAVVLGGAYLFATRPRQAIETGLLVPAPRAPLVGVPAEPRHVPTEPSHVAHVLRDSGQSIAAVRMVGLPDPGHVVSLPRDSGRSIAVRLTGQPDPGHVSSGPRNAGRSIAVRVTGLPDPGHQEIVEHQR